LRQLQLLADHQAGKLGINALELPQRDIFGDRIVDSILGDKRRMSRIGRIQIAKRLRQVVLKLHHLMPQIHQPNDFLLIKIGKNHFEGVGGRKLMDKWADGPTAWLGLMVAGFPNLMMIHGPLTPGAQAQMLMVGEWQVNLVGDIIDSLERDHYSRIDTWEEAEGWWAEEVNTLSHNTLHRFANSWYNAKNIEGKKGGFMIYVGGFPRFARLNNEAIADGFRGFIRS